MKSALSDLYQEELLAYASAVEQFSRLQKPTGTGTAVSRSCGSRVTVDLMLLEDVISDIGLDVDACALGSASSAIVAEKAVGKTLDEISSLGQSIWCMLRDGGAIPTGDWETCPAGSGHPFQLELHSGPGRRSLQQLRARPRLASTPRP